MGFKKKEIGGGGDWLKRINLSNQRDVSYGLNLFYIHRKEIRER